jgi:hypothetical protein
MANDPVQTQITTLLLDNGNVEFKVPTQDGKDLFFVLTPEQEAALATQLLVQLHSAFIFTQAQPVDLDTTIKLSATIPVRKWFFGHNASQKFIGAQIGNTPIGFTIVDSEMRSLGRTLVEVSWKTKSDASAWTLLARLHHEFFVDLFAWCGIVWTRALAGLKRRALHIGTFVSGRSFRAFRHVRIAPGVKMPTYTGPDLCIYCGESYYSRKPGVRTHPLGAEHIIAEGLGGTLELPLASCADCEHITGAMIEGEVLGRTLRALRIFLNLKKRGSGPPLKTLRLEAKVDGRDVILELPTEEYPILFYMVALGPHELDGPGGTPSSVGFHFVSLRYDQNHLFRKYRIGGFSSPILDQHALVRMLAKIGHSFAVAELTLDLFKPALTGLIRFGDMAASKFVAGIFDGTRERASEALHELALGYQRMKGKTYVVARVRLFAKFGGPTYSVIVGESLERPIARAKRVFSNRISRMLAR